MMFFKTADTLVLALAAKAYSSKSLTPLAISMAMITGLVHTRSSSLLPFMLLAAFYITGSKFTKYKAKVKAEITSSEEEEMKKGRKETEVKETTKKEEGKLKKEQGEQRGAIQVLANSLTASILILVQLFYSSSSDLFLVGIVSHYSAVCADTWSSELGILSSSFPILITTLKPCPKGTNGAVSPLGLCAAVAGGAFIGFVTILMLYIPATFSFFFSNTPSANTLSYITYLAQTIQIQHSIWLFPFGAAIGLFGSILDSVLGATLQQSVAEKERKTIVEAKNGGKLKSSKQYQLEKYTIVSGIDVLSNNQVNLLTSIVSSLVGICLWHVMFM